MQTSIDLPPTSTDSRLPDTDYPVTSAQIESYRRDGFVQINDVITGSDLARLRHAVEADVANENILAATTRESAYGQVLLQTVNLWQRDATVRAWVLSRRLGNLAARLSGHPQRVWHDQALFKKGKTGAKTPWHQDAIYWPHAAREHQLSIWIALRDVTIQNGCMSFIPGSHHIRHAHAIDLVNPQDIFEMAPEMRGIKPVTCPLQAGSATFHHGMNFHFAGPNRTEEEREAFAVIYMPDGTRFDGRSHCVTDPLALQVGDPLDNDTFPLVGALD